MNRASTHRPRRSLRAAAASSRNLLLSWELCRWLLAPAPAIAQDTTKQTGAFSLPSSMYSGRGMAIVLLMSKRFMRDCGCHFRPRAQRHDHVLRVSSLLVLIVGNSSPPVNGGEWRSGNAFLARNPKSPLAALSGFLAVT